MHPDASAHQYAATGLGADERRNLCGSLAARAIAETGDDDAARIEYIFRSLLARDPDDVERKTLRAGYAKRFEYFRQNPAAARELIKTGESKAPEDLDPIELATLSTVAMNILNLDETITRE